MGFGSSRVKLKEEQKPILNEQMSKSICQIRINREDKGFGFLAISPKTKKYILITKNESKYFSQENDIEIIINNKGPILLSQQEPRIIYYNEKNSITILEIIKEDEIDKTNFLEFDYDNEERENKFEFYKNKEIYIITYRTKDKIVYPLGKITDIENNNIFKHNCKDIESNTFPFPIFSLKNYKVIGINESINTGLFLDEILKEFNELVKSKEININKGSIEEIKKDNKNKNINVIDKKLSDEIRKRMNENRKQIEEKKERMLRSVKQKNNLSFEYNEKNIILLIVEVNYEDINEEIYFLDNYKYINQIKKRESGFLKEIENLKEKITFQIIDPKDKRIDMIFNNKFIPKEKGNYSIEIEIPELIKDCSYMFYGCTNIIDIDLSNFDLQGATKMKDMFNYCINLQNVRFPQFPLEKITNTSYMFNYCKKLSKIDLSNLNTENIISMAGMFQHCESLEFLDLSNFDIKNNTQLSCMFNNCYKLTDIKFSEKFNTKKVMFMPWMFYGCENLTILNLTSFNIDQNIIRDMSDMFIGCDKLEEILINEESKNLFISTNEYMNEKFKI